MADCLDRLPVALAAVASHLSASAVAIWASALMPPMRSSGLTTPRRAAMLLGQCAEESGGFSVLTEDLNYSAARLCAVWPGRFPTLAAAAPYAHNPQALADHVYAGRLGNGPEGSHDGWRFRGEGLIELTGRALDTRFAQAFGKSLDDALAWMCTPEGAAASACWYWIDRGQLLAMSDAWDVAGVTERINGGLTNLATRERLCGAALAAFGASPAPSSGLSADDLNARALSGASFPVKQ